MAENPAGEQNVRPAAVIVRAYGPCDNDVFFNKYLEASVYNKQLMLTNINTYPFTDSWDTSALPTMVYLASLGRYLYTHQAGRPDEVVLYAAALAETLGPCINANYILNEVDSARMFIHSVKALMEPGGIAEAFFREPPRNVFLAEDALCHDEHGLPRVPPLESFFQGHRLGDDPNLDHYPVPLAAMWPATREEIRDRAMTVREACLILYFLSRQTITRALKGGLAMIAHIIVAVVKRGSVTDDFLKKIERGIQDDLHKTVSLSPDIVRQFYVSYGSCIDANNIEQVFERWQGEIPETALRLMLTVNQAGGGGMTVYFTIRDALSRHPRFRWDLIRDILPDDWNRFVIAADIVRHNPYYGFNKDLGAARSTFYKNLGFVAKELLVRANGEVALNRYAGWPRSIPQATRIYQIIDRYLAAMGQGDAEGDAMRNEGDLDAVVENVLARIAQP